MTDLPFFRIILVLQKIFDKIREIALAFDKEQFPRRNLHLTFIIYKGKIIVIGQNNKKTHPINLKNRKINKDGEDISGIKGVCAELSALRRLVNLTNIPAGKCSLINIRINKNNLVGNSKPYMSCESLIRHYNITDITYSNNYGEFIKMVL